MTETQRNVIERERERERGERGRERGGVNGEDRERRKKNIPSITIKNLT